MSSLADATWPEVERGGVLVVPLGATEQHGPHLPTGTDTVIVEALAERLDRARRSCWVAPTLPIGASGEHAGFPGTISFGTRALAVALIELGRSADHFDGIFFLNWHGGNAEAVDEAVSALRREGRQATRWRSPPSAREAPGDLHAGQIETSLMLAIAPDSIREDRVEAGPAGVPGEIVSRIRSGGVRSVSGTGVLGDPRAATEAAGQRLLRVLVESLTESYDEFEAGLG